MPLQNPALLLTVGLLLGAALGAQSASAAEPSEWQLQLTGEAKLGKESRSFSATGSLSLLADRTYEQLLDGEPSTGAWFRDGSRLLLFGDGSILEDILALEAALADALGEPVEVVPLGSKGKAQIKGRNDEFLQMQFQNKAKVLLLRSGRTLPYSEKLRIFGARLPD